MLVLSRKISEEIRIGDDIIIKVNRINGGRVSIGVEAPDHVKIVRGELKQVVDQFKDNHTDNRRPYVPNGFDASANMGSRLAR